MKFTFAEKLISGLKAEQLEAIGLTEHDFKELTEVIACKAITNMTKNPAGLPADLMKMLLPVLGSTKLSDVKKEFVTEEKLSFDVCGETRNVTLKYYPCPERYKKNDGINRMILMVHGFQSCDTFMLRYAQNYFVHGFDVVIFDQRGHNEADKVTCTMGYLEAFDVVEIAKHLRNKLGENAIIGVQGESYGSATTCQAMDKLAEITQFSVVDCGYSDMDELARWIEKLFVPYEKESLAKLVDLLSDINGIKFSDIKPIEHVAATPADYPVMFIHGGIDFFVCTHFSKDMYEAKQGKKRIKIYRNCFHAMSQALHKKSYQKQVNKFLKENEII